MVIIIPLDIPIISFIELNVLFDLIHNSIGYVTDTAIKIIIINRIFEGFMVQKDSISKSINEVD